MYRRPFLRETLRSRADTPDLARALVSSLEAAGLQPMRSVTWFELSSPIQRLPCGSTNTLSGLEMLLTSQRFSAFSSYLGPPTMSGFRLLVL